MLLTSTGFFILFRSRAVDYLPFRSISQNSLACGQNPAQGDVAPGFCRSGEGSAPPHPCFHHVKGCGKCHSPARTVLYTHSLTPAMNDLGWTGIFQQKSFPPEKADKAQSKSSGEGFYSIRAFGGNKARSGQVLNPLPTQPWPPWSCGHSISQLMDEPGQKEKQILQQRLCRLI